VAFDSLDLRWRQPELAKAVDLIEREIREIRAIGHLLGWHELEQRGHRGSRTRIGGVVMQPPEIAKDAVWRKFLDVGTFAIERIDAASQHRDCSACMREQPFDVAILG